MIYQHLRHEWKDASKHSHINVSIMYISDLTATTYYLHIHVAFSLTSSRVAIKLKANTRKNILNCSTASFFE